MSLHLLKNLLNKKGLTQDKMSPDDKETYEMWRRALQGKRLTDEEVKAFFEQQYNESVRLLTSPEISNEMNIFLKAKINLILIIKDVVLSPDLNKQAAVQEIQRQLNE